MTPTTNQERDEAMRETPEVDTEFGPIAHELYLWAEDDLVPGDLKALIRNAGLAINRLELRAARTVWRDIEDDPPLDREFLGCRVGMKRHDGEPLADMTFHIRGRHIDYAGGPREWTWNGANSGNYGIQLTHWCELPERPASTNQEHGEG